MTIQRFIDALATMPADRHVWFDFPKQVPTKFASWRGIYSELALGYAKYEWRDGGYGPEMTVGELLAAACAMIGATIEGYKGGEYIVHPHTKLYVDNWGDYSGAKITGVYDDGVRVIIETRMD